MSHSSSLITAVMLVDLSYVFVTNLAALFCTISILFMSSFWWGSQIEFEYLMGLEQEYKLRLMKPKERYAEEVMLFM